MLQDEGTVKNDQGQIDNAKLNLDYCHITSPINGRVGLRLVDPGNIVHATDTTALVVITQLQPITVIFTIAEDDLPQIQAAAARRTARWRWTPSTATQQKQARHRHAARRSTTRSTRPPARCKLQARSSPTRTTRCSRTSSSTRGCWCNTQQDATLVPTRGHPAQRAGRPSSTSSSPTRPSTMRNVTVGTTDGDIDRGRSGLDAGDVVVDRRRRQAAGRRQGRRAAGERRQPAGDGAGDGRQADAAPAPAGNAGSAGQPRRSTSASESVPAVHSAAGRDVAADGGDPAGRRRRATRQLPVSALPEVDYPTIQVVTFYPGASPDVMASSVTAPLERQFGQVPGLNQMTSTSSDGSSVITLQFILDLNIDVAEQEVQASINAARTLSARRPADPADLQQDQSGRRADPDAGADLRRRCRCRRSRTWPTRAWRRRSRSCRASAW